MRREGDTEAIAVMRELGIDISAHPSQHVDEFHGQGFDYVITVCDNVKESCPVLLAAARHLHNNLEDPPPAEERTAIFRRVRMSFAHTSVSLQIGGDGVSRSRRKPIISGRA